MFNRRSMNMYIGGDRRRRRNGVDYVLVRELYPRSGRNGFDPSGPNRRRGPRDRHCNHGRHFLWEESEGDEDAEEEFSPPPRRGGGRSRGSTIVLEDSFFEQAPPPPPSRRGGGRNREETIFLDDEFLGRGFHSPTTRGGGRDRARSASCNRNNDLRRVREPPLTIPPRRASSRGLAPNRRAALQDGPATDDYDYTRNARGRAPPSNECVEGEIQSLEARHSQAEVRRGGRPGNAARRPSGFPAGSPLMMSGGLGPRPEPMVDEEVGRVRSPRIDGGPPPHAPFHSSHPGMLGGLPHPLFQPPRPAMMGGIPYVYPGTHSAAYAAAAARTQAEWQEEMEMRQTVEMMAAMGLIPPGRF